MRLRISSGYLRKRTERLTRKQKMESRRRGKRKSSSKAIIFEVSDDDVSSEQSDAECSEPDAKILKTEGKAFKSNLSDNSNLESDTQILSPKIPVSEDNSENSVEIIECISISNTSTIDNLTSTNDIIITTEDNTDESNTNVVNTEATEKCSNNIIEITESNLDTLNDEDFNLEEGELAEVQIQNEPQDQLDSTESHQKSNPCICITFGDEEMADIYKSKFLKFIESFVELEVENYEGLTINVQRDSDLNPNECIVLNETTCENEVVELADEKLASPLPTTPIVAPLKKKKKKKNKKEKDLFILDTNPSLNESVGHHTKYLTKFQIDIAEKATTEGESVRISVQTCFNCDSNHAIKDCPLPRDFSRINAARQKFRAQKLTTSRYHLEEDQKYGHLVPGKISDKLRQAMGLRKNQLPPYIYHMRLLGYPPGWLEEAKFVHSNLAMFDSEGNNVRDAIRKKQGLDTAKIVNYPGFNVPMGKDAKDEYRQYQVPPYSEDFSKKAMIEFFEKQFAKQQDDLEACDMDLDSTFEENKEKTVTEEISEKIVAKNPLISELKDTDPDIPSPSLTDLEKRKKNLLAALDDNSKPKSAEIATCEEPEKIDDAEILSDIEKPQSSKNEKAVDQPLEIDIESTRDSNKSYLSPPLNSSVNSVKNSTFGTPILKSSSPYSRLPNPDNFMKDVSPVINFENLPNSTGKYEQMTGVLQKVRNTLKNLQNCKS